MVLVGRGTSEVAIDQAVRNALLRLGPATRVDSLGFVPPAADRLVLQDIRRKRERLSLVMDLVIQEEIRGASDEDQRQPRNFAHQLAADLYQTAAELSNATTAATEDVIAQNSRSYASQRELFIGVALGALGLALLLGLVLSWSVSADPADRFAVGHDRVRRLLGAREREQPR